MNQDQENALTHLLNAKRCKELIDRLRESIIDSKDSIIKAEQKIKDLESDMQSSLDQATRLIL